jgi:hypothetical protein
MGVAPVSSDPWHWFGGSSSVFVGADLTPLESFSIYASEPGRIHILQGN